MRKTIFEQKFSKLKLEKHTSKINHCNALASAGYYTESFLALWILVEVISKEIQVIYRTSIAVESLSNSILKVFITNNIDIEKQNIRNQVMDISFSKTKEICAKRREAINVAEVILGLKFTTENIDEQMLMFLLASKIKEAPIGSSAKTTIRAKRNELVHKNSSVSKDDFNRYMDYFNYFFSLTVFEKTITNVE